MIKKVIRPVILDVNSSVDYICVIDTTPANEALLNSAGWPANEISLLIKLNNEGKLNEPYAQSLLNGLNELPSPQVDNSGKSNQEILAAVIPRHIGTLGEYMKYLDSLPLSEREREFMEQSAKDYFAGDGDAEEVDPEPVPSGE